MNTTTTIFKPVAENTLIESFARLVREPTDETRYDTTWNQVIELIGGYFDDLYERQTQ